MIIAGLIVVAGVIGFDLIMRLQTVITIVTGALTVVYILLVVDEVDPAAIAALPAGAAPAVIGGLVFMMTGFGLGWVNAAADYSRYLPRNARSGAVVAWTTFGCSLGPVVLLIFGLMLAGSSADLSSAIAADPIGALTTVLPTWFLIPFALVAVLGLVGGAVLDIYSSGLALLSAGLKVPRYVAAGIDGVLMTLGAIYVVFVATDFLGPFQGFLITLGVPIAAWCGIFVAEVALRRRDYAEADLYDPNGRYGSVRWVSIGLVLLGTFLGWGLVTNSFAGWLGWQGYLLGPLGGREGAWAFANLGVLVSLLMGFVGTLLLSRSAIRAPGVDSGVNLPWLVAIDLQVIFADPASAWRTPDFAEPRPRPSACCRRSANGSSSPDSWRPGRPKVPGCPTTPTGRSPWCRRPTGSTTWCRRSRTSTSRW